MPFLWHLKSSRSRPVTRSGRGKSRGTPSFTAPVSPMTPSEDQVIENVLAAEALVLAARVGCAGLSGKSLAFDDILRHLSMASQHLDAAHTLIDALRKHP